MTTIAPKFVVTRTLVVVALVGCGGKGSGAASDCDGYVYCGDGWEGGSGGTESSGGKSTGDSGGTGSVGSSSEGGTTTCSGAAPCGGILDSTWQFDSVCLEGDFAQATNAQMIADGGPPECDGMYQTSEYSTTGTVTFTDVLSTSDLNYRVASRIEVTARCDRALHGGPAVALTAARCADIALGLLSTGYDSAACSLVSDVCACDVKSHRRESPGPWEFVISGDLVSFVNAKSWKYCVEGPVLTIRWTMFDALPVVAVGTLHRI